MSGNSSPIIRLENISKHFPGVQALDQVSVTFYPGEIHAVVGENGAGKSTLMNILAGELQPDAGEIIYMGEKLQIPHPAVSQQLGISVVYQELALCSNLSIAENISLNRVGAQFSLNLLNRRMFLETAREALTRLGLEHIDLNRPVGRLSIAQQQMVEIARAISSNARVLILDEPNSALTQDETEHLFQVLRQLRDAGVAIIYVSHRLEEVLSLADRITVLRDGKLIDTVNAADITVDGLIARMVGRVVDRLYHHEKKGPVRPEVAFEVRNLRSGADLENISFLVRAGEILGIAGLPDAGKDELIECCFGLRPYSGEILIGNRPVPLDSPATAIQHGLAFAPADRRQSGALLVMDVQDNIVAANLSALNRAGFLDQPAIQTLGQAYVEKLDIRVASLSQQMATLSGGNQQKVVLARGLATHPSVFLVHEPTRGIDVGAKAEIYTILQELASQGVAIVIVSSELPELIGQCDRILVMHQGQITGHFQQSEFDEERILACAMGQSVHLGAGSKGSKGSR